MAVPLIDSGIGSQEIVVFFPFNIPDKNAFAPFEDNGIGW
jgi:hypothetical protein